MRAVNLILTLCALTISSVGAHAQERQQPSLAIIEIGDSTARVAEELAKNLGSARELRILDGDQARTAARGTAYFGSFNLSTMEARDLGAAIGCDFFIIVTAETLRRSPSTGPNYFESYAWIFLVSGRTGKLIFWQHPSSKAATFEASERLLLADLGGSSVRISYLQAIREAEAGERNERQSVADQSTPVIEAAPDDEADALAQGLRLPRPYRRLMPRYPDTAALAEVEGVVDVLVDIDAQGEVNQAEVARWAGFGLDQASLDTVRQLHFVPAMRDGIPIPIRVLLRYNFRRPATR